MSGITRSPDGSRIEEMKRFLVDALGGALEHGFAIPDDVLKHVTPDVLAEHLPRPLWAKLITACLAAPKVDAKLIVDTIGVVDLCANVPATLLWQVVADVAARALGKGLLASPPPAEKAAEKDKAAEKAADKDKPSEKAADKDKADERPARSGHVTGSWSGGEERPVVARPATSPAFPTRPATSPGTPIAAKPATATTPATGIPEITRSPDGSRTTTAPASGSGRAATATSTQTSAAPAPVAVDIFFEDDDEPAPLDAPPVSPHRATTVRPGTAGNGSNTRPPVGAGASSRRPQASAMGTPAPTPRTKPRTMPPSGRRGAPANSDFDLDTDVGTNEKQPDEVPVDDDQLVDWSASEETVTSGHDVDRKR